MNVVACEEAHAGAVSALCLAEGWESWSVERAQRALGAPGATSIVAVEDGAVVGAAHVVSDGAVTHYLAMLVVARGHRGRGIGGALLDEVFTRSTASRMDVLATDESLAFYRARPHRELKGFRLYAESAQ